MSKQSWSIHSETKTIECNYDIYAALLDNGLIIGKGADHLVTENTIEVIEALKSDEII